MTVFPWELSSTVQKFPSLLSSEKTGRGQAQFPDFFSLRSPGLHDFYLMIMRIPLCHSCLSLLSLSLSLRWLQSLKVIPKPKRSGKVNRSSWTRVKEALGWGLRKVSWALPVLLPFRSTVWSSIHNRSPGFSPGCISGAWLKAWHHPGSVGCMQHITVFARLHWCPLPPNKVLTPKGRVCK